MNDAKLKLPSLPTDIFRLFLDQLSQSDRISLSLVSHACRIQCEPVVFRTITVGACKERGLSITSSITNSLQKQFRTIVSGTYQEKRSSSSASIIQSLERYDGRMAKMVRHLVIPFYADKSFVSTKTILRIMKSTENLASLSWNADYAIPTSVLAALQSDHPSAHLKVAYCIVALG